MAQALIIRGYCGSGKSTVAKAIAGQQGWAFLEYDTFLWGFNSFKTPKGEDYEITWKNFMSVLSNYVEANKSLVIEGPLVARTNEDPFSLAKVQALLIAANYDLKIIQLRASDKILHKRMVARDHIVPTEEQQDFMTKHQAQTLDEEVVIDTSDLNAEKVLAQIMKYLV
jgi:gluconate kinase